MLPRPPCFWRDLGIWREEKAPIAGQMSLIAHGIKFNSVNHIVVVVVIRNTSVLMYEFLREIESLSNIFEKDFKPRLL